MRRRRGFRCYRRGAIGRPPLLVRLRPAFARGRRRSFGRGSFSGFGDRFRCRPCFWRGRCRWSWRGRRPGCGLGGWRWQLNFAFHLESFRGCDSFFLIGFVVFQRFRGRILPRTLLGGVRVVLLFRSREIFNAAEPNDVLRVGRGAGCRAPANQSCNQSDVRQRDEDNVPPKGLRRLRHVESLNR